MVFANPEQDRRADQMKKVHRIGGLRISRVAPVGDRRASAALPDLAPPEERLQKARSHIFTADAISLSHDSAMEDVFDPHRRLEHRDIVARMTLYVVNLIVIVFALPLGLALLCFNILGGENLRTSAHALALTGLFMALSASPGGGELMSLIVGA